MVSIVGDVLREAAAKVDARGTVKGVGFATASDSGSVTCATVSVAEAVNGNHLETELWESALTVLAATVGVRFTGSPTVFWPWNDAQPSRAAVAAEMRSAADLADLLYGNV